MEYHIVWGFLVGQVTVLLFLMVPIPVGWKSKAMVGLTKHKWRGTVNNCLKLFFLLSLFLFLDAGSRAMLLHREKKQLRQEGRFGHHETALNLKLFYAQRNTYLTGFTLLLALVLREMMALITRQASLEGQIVELRKQIQNQLDVAYDPSMQSNERILMDDESIEMKEIARNVGSIADMRQRKVL